MIIDCHGHYTIAPEPHQLFREALPELPHISDDQIRESVETNQLRLLKERGADMTIQTARG